MNTLDDYIKSTEHNAIADHIEIRCQVADKLDAAKLDEARAHLTRRLSEQGVDGAGLLRNIQLQMQEVVKEGAVSPALAILITTWAAIVEKALSAARGK